MVTLIFAGYSKLSLASHDNDFVGSDRDLQTRVQRLKPSIAKSANTYPPIVPENSLSPLFPILYLLVDCFVSLRLSIEGLSFKLVILNYPFSLHPNLREKDNCISFS